MRFEAPNHDRRSIRVPGFDYAQPGAYFVTICTRDRLPLFGRIIRGAMRLSRMGWIVSDEWMRTPAVRPYVRSDAFVVMPDHVHGIIVIADDRGVARCRTAPIAASGPASGSVGAIVGQFKSVATKRINAVRETPGALVWQRGYYECVVRDRAMLNRIRRYIADNPARWAGGTGLGASDRITP